MDEQTIRASIEARIAAAKQKREDAGLKVTFLIPADDINPEPREWACYPHNAATRANWIEAKAKLGWTVIA